MKTLIDFIPSEDRLKAREQVLISKLERARTKWMRIAIYNELMRTDQEIEDLRK